MGLSTHALAEEFPQAESINYLNHAAIAPWPRRTRDAIAAFADDVVRFGAAHMGHWNRVDTRLRERFRELINAPGAADIALLKNTSEALSVVAYGLPWQPGDNVVLASEEFVSNRIVWESLAKRGVEARQVSLSDTHDPEAALIQATDARTRLLTTSSVHYGDGLTMDVERLGEHCRRRDIRFCVDAIQSLGALPFDAQAVHADYVMADGHKWLLGPEGVAGFYCRPERRDELDLLQYGWRMVEEPFDFDRREWRPAADAKRFECGSPNTLGSFGLEASLGLLQEHGIEQVAADLLERSRWLAEALSGRRGLELITRAESDRLAGIVTFRPRNGASDELYRFLRARGIYCARRGGGIRLSPHFYTPMSQLEEVVEAIDRWSRNEAS